MSVGHLLVRARGVRARTVLWMVEEGEVGVTNNAGFWLFSHFAEARSGGFIPDLIQRVYNFVKKKLFG